MKACLLHILSLTLMTAAGCGKDTHTSTSPDRQSAINSGKKSDSIPPQSQDSTGRIPGANNKSQTPPTPISEDQDPSLPQLAPSKLAWNGESFIGSATFALIPLE